MSEITDKFQARIAELESLLHKSINESIQSARKLKELEEFNFALFQYSPIETVIVDMEGRVVKSNLAKRKSGDRMPELGDRMYVDYAAHHEIDMRANLLDAINKGKLIKYPEIQYKEKYLSITIAPFSGGAIITSENITERKKNELAYQTIVDNSIQGLSIIQDYRIVFCNHRLAEIFGTSSQVLIEGEKKSILSYVHPEDREILKERFKKRIAGEDVPNKYEFKGIRKDGKTVWLECFAKVIKYLGKPAVQCVYIDITEKKEAEQALKRAEEFQRYLLNSTPHVYVLIGRDLSFLAYNRTFAEIFEKVIGKELRIGDNAVELMGEEYRLSMQKNLGKAFNGETVTVERKFPEFKDNPRIYQITYSPALSERGEVDAVCVSGIDITKVKEHEQERIKLAKLESVGILAGGIAHDFNNILTSILGNISLSKLEVQSESDIEKFLEESEIACLRARDLTNQLLTFSRGGTPVKRITRIGKLIVDTASFALRGSAINIEYAIDENLWPVEVDEGQISQVIHNMVINAIQATDDSGKIKISAANLTGQYDSNVKSVRIVIEDNGHGIERELLSKIFDPYFTTKSQGSGLGLATSHSIISNHEGSISVISNVGKGTSFQIVLPVKDQVDTAKSDLITKTSDNLRLKVLVMDDEEMVLDISSRMLAKLGHSYELARDGEEAIERYVNASRSGNPFDVVIMDLTVKGGMGGSVAMERLLELDPDIKAIVSSGYSNAPVMSDYRKYGFRGIVSKPYRLDELSAMLDSVYSEDQ